MDFFFSERVGLLVLLTFSWERLHQGHVSWMSSFTEAISSVVVQHICSKVCPTKQPLCFRKDGCLTPGHRELITPRSILTSTQRQWVQSLVDARGPTTMKPLDGMYPPTNP